MELTFIKADGEELVRAFKTPSLRDVAERPPFMHAGQIASLADVVAHYNLAPTAPEGHSELVPLGLSHEEREALVAFLASLSSLDPPSD
ncbi:tryptophan tryptophylquinone biosynthesis enzyme MauG [compost metagenome]